ncbi:Uncharacterised protein [Klebsiella pneumoniae]|nr:Uncharacterised protein [Klebsiella pneumoniae]
MYLRWKQDCCLIVKNCSKLIVFLPFTNKPNWFSKLNELIKPNVTYQEKVVKSLPSSRREVLVDCFHVYTYHIGYLLPGSAVLQHSAASLHTSVVITRRRPPTLPCSLAAAKPARVRSTISSRSISARALMTVEEKAAGWRRSGQSSRSGCGNSPRAPAAPTRV